MLEIHGLTKRCGDVLALDDASFTVVPGRIVGSSARTGRGRRRRCARSSDSWRGWRRHSVARASGRSEAARPLRLYARGARPLPEDEGRRAARVLLRSPEGVFPYVTIHVGVDDLCMTLRRAEELGGKMIVEMPIPGLADSQCSRILTA
jgi:hypothetical protein